MGGDVVCHNLVALSLCFCDQAYNPCQYLVVIGMRANDFFGWYLLWNNQAKRLFYYFFDVVVYLVVRVPRHAFSSRGEKFCPFSVRFFHFCSLVLWAINFKHPSWMDVYICGIISNSILFGYRAPCLVPLQCLTFLNLDFDYF